MTDEYFKLDRYAVLRGNEVTESAVAGAIMAIAIKASG